MNDNYFSLEKLLDYQGNRYELARACMEYARRVRYLVPNEYQKMGEKEALVSLHHLLEGGIKYTSDRFEIEIYEDEAEVIVSQREAERLKKLEKDSGVQNDAESTSENEDEEEEEDEEETEEKIQASDSAPADASDTPSPDSPEETKQNKPQPLDTPTDI